MDCLRAQEVICEALDGAPVDQAGLAEAREHCRACEECGMLVRTLLAIRRAGTPAMPAGLEDRIVAAVRAEAAAETAVTEPAKTHIRTAGHAPAQDSVTGAPATSAVATPLANQIEHEGSAATSGTRKQDLMSRLTDPARRRSVAAWLASAAILFVLAGAGAIAGIRAILVPQPVLLSSTQLDARSSRQYAESAAPLSAEESAADSAKAASGAAITATAGNNYITLNGLAYRLTGPAQGVVKTSLTRQGSTRNSLDTDLLASDRDVLGAGDPNRVYVEGKDGLLAFERVTRAYDGRVYVLRSEPVEKFGVSPVWPATIPKPTAMDGSPTMAEDGVDPTGTKVYHRIGWDAGAGIAVPPGTGASDPLPGSTDWTWWEVR